jgi:hypothetical protein
VHPGRAIALDELLTTLFRHGFDAFRAGVSFTSDVRIRGDRRDRARRSSIRAAAGITDRPAQSCDRIAENARHPRHSFE